MKAPGWIADTVREFAKAAGLDEFGLSEQGVAAMRFENGISLRFEYIEGRLIVAATVPADNDIESSRRILAVSHPFARRSFTIRSGYLSKSQRAIFAVSIAEGDVTLPEINAVFGALWNIALENGGAM